MCNMQGSHIVKPFCSLFTQNWRVMMAAIFTIVFGSVSAAQTTVLPTKQMIEFRYVPLDYYFLTSIPSEQTSLSSAAGWVKTGESFNVYSTLVGANASESAALPICRFAFPAIARAGARWSHFYTLDRSEGDLLRMQNPANATAPKVNLYDFR